MRADRRGTAIGVPTANVDPTGFVLPPGGVYAGWAEGEFGKYPAAVNLGTRPTVTKEKTVVLEAHLLDFSGDLYGQRIEISFSRRIRDEKQFSGVEELVRQVHQDIQAVRELLSNQQTNSQANLLTDTKL